MSESLKIGIPRALLYHRYKTLWRTFFESLGCEVIVSSPTTQKTYKQGSALAIDEACLSLKIFLGHVNELVGKCDYIFIPGINNYGRGRDVCSRYAALYDIAENAFKNSGQRFLGASIDVIKGITEEDALKSVIMTVGFNERQAKEAYRIAKKEYEKEKKAAVAAQAQLLKQQGTKILVAAHSYVFDDDFMGKGITDYLKKNGITVIRADVIDHEEGRKLSKKLSPTCRWELNREILGGIEKYRNYVSGIILVSTFPCGTDAMVNELLVRRLGKMPVLTLVLDGQTGTAGLETRLESFLDIIHFKEAGK